MVMAQGVQVQVHGGGDVRPASALTQPALEALLGFRVLDFSKYVSVFTHKSAMKVTNGDSYERYEFIGDAVINFVVAKLLFDMYPRADEGFLTRIRTKLVSGKCLSQLAWHLGLHNFIIMNQRSMRHGFNTNPRILEDVFEALVGCIYLQSGMVTAKTFLLSVFQRFVDFNDILRDTNYKDGLMRYAQARGMPLPEYVVVSSASSTASFVVHVALCGRVGQGAGASKKQAEQEAARTLLGLLGGLTPQGDVNVTTVSNGSNGANNTNGANGTHSISPSSSSASLSPSLSLSSPGYESSSPGFESSGSPSPPPPPPPPPPSLPPPPPPRPPPPPPSYRYPYAYGCTPPPPPPPPPVACGATR